VVASLAALALRLIFVSRFPGVVTDSFIYGDIAKNWLQHGIYGLSGPDEISPTYIRLPGYPGFLAFIFAIFGVDHYRAALFTQVMVDVGTCFFCADIVRRVFGPRFAKIAFLLAALCPFLADYSAAALTETLEVFFTAMAIDFAIAGLQKHKVRSWISCGVASASAVLLRPDGALLVFAIELYIIGAILFGKKEGSRRLRVQALLIIFAIAVAPLVPWTLRNWQTFQRFQPLAPRYANEENEFVPMGFNRWVKTWIADYTSVEEVYWQVPGSKIDPAQLPRRALDTESQQSVTEQVVEAYNNELHVSPDLDKKFDALAAERIRAHPIRYFIGLPLLRILDMWVRPRTEMLPCDSRWWEFNDEPKWSGLAVSLGAINLAYLMCALAGWMRSHDVPLTRLLLLFVILRSFFLGTLENPEPRYTLEMYPIVIIFAAAALSRSQISSAPEVRSIGSDR
jgi:4-amino-4-deoxy-L-arabinose transferase-like glycosyltransferase